VVDHLGIVARSLASADQLAEQVVRALRWSDRPLSVDAAPLGPLVDEAAATAGVAVAAPPAAADVLVDRELVTWAVTELLVNARTFAGGDAATVEVAARPAPPGWCELVVRDDGPGIADDLLDDAFQPGRQLQARGEVTGVGMGLALCRLVFERHAGWCRAEPVTTGTTIAVRLPAADGAARR
jgi:signal transduction histidine kinase